MEERTNERKKEKKKDSQTRTLVFSINLFLRRSHLMMNHHWNCIHHRIMWLLDWLRIHKTEKRETNKNIIHFGQSQPCISFTMYVYFRLIVCWGFSFHCVHSTIWKSAIISFSHSLIHSFLLLCSLALATVDSLSSVIFVFTDPSIIL